MPTRLSGLALGAFVVALALAGCRGEEERAVQEVPEELELPEGSLFSVDTQTPSFEVVIAGEGNHRVEAVLVDSDGRRRLELDNGDSGRDVIRPTGWVILSAGAQSGDTLCVCWSELNGRPSNLTTGQLPDPTDGVDLRCRFRTATGWSASVDAAPEASVAWLQDVTVDGEGFVVTYRRDAGYLVLDTSSDDGSYARRLVPGEDPGPSDRISGPDGPSEGGEL
jgi:hypothetical protein